MSPLERQILEWLATQDEPSALPDLSAAVELPDLDDLAHAVTRLLKDSLVRVTLSASPPVIALSTVRITAAGRRALESPQLTPATAWPLLQKLREATAGAILCRDRHVALFETSPVLDVGASVPIRLMTDMRFNDANYYAWEAGRIVKLAQRTRRAGLDPQGIKEALDSFTDAAPRFREFRDGATHPEDNRSNDYLIMGGIRPLPGGRVEYLLDPRHGHHALLMQVCEVTDRALAGLVGDLGDDDQP